MQYPCRSPHPPPSGARTSASHETFSDSAPTAEDVEQRSKETARTIPSSWAREEKCNTPWRPPLGGA
eukprot:4878460-Pyramimonas_sp.AAC.1